MLLTVRNINVIDSFDLKRKHAKLKGRSLNAWVASGALLRGVHPETAWQPPWVAKSPHSSPF